MSKKDKSNLDAEDEGAAKKPSIVKTLIVKGGLFLIVAGIGGAGAFYAVASGMVVAPAGGGMPQLAGAASAPEAEVHPMSYFAIENPFTCNLKASSRLMQVSISVSTKADPKIFEAITEHEAPIRASILALLMSQTLEDISSVEGKNALRASLRDAINRELKARAGSGGIDEVFFTDMIIQ